MIQLAKRPETTVFIDNLYPKVKASLSNKETKSAFKRDIDRYLADNIDCYSTVGPSKKPIFGISNSDKLVKLVGLDNDTIKSISKGIKNSDANWKTINTPFNIAITLAVRFASLSKDEEMINCGLRYMIANFYAYAYGKFFKYGLNDSVMAYTIANMSQRFKIKKNPTLLATLLDIASVCYKTHETDLSRGQDWDVMYFISDMSTRINSFIRKLCNEYMENIKEGNYLVSEHEDFSDENYHEADNDSYAIERITNKVLTNLIVNGPDRKLVELSAKISKVSINTLQTSILTLISNDKNKDDIKRITELLLSLYLSDKDASIRDIGTNKFYLYCYRIYKQSNTINPNIIEIKKILDRWIVDLNLRKKVDTVASLSNYRKAMYLFFVLTIEKLN